MLLNLLVNILIIITNLTTVSEIKKKTEKKKIQFIHGGDLAISRNGTKMKVRCLKEIENVCACVIASS